MKSVLIRYVWYMFQIYSSILVADYIVDIQDQSLVLTHVMLNKLWCHAHFCLSANQVTWFRLLIQIHILNDKQYRSTSFGFLRSQLIWIYTVCKGREYLDSEEPGLILSVSVCDGQFDCGGGVCIALAKRCDSFPDCDDHRDEEHCSSKKWDATEKTYLLICAQGRLRSANTSAQSDQSLSSTWKKFCILGWVKVQTDLNVWHYENTPIQIYWKYYHQKWKFSEKKILIFFKFLLKT